MILRAAGVGALLVLLLGFAFWIGRRTAPKVPDLPVFVQTDTLIVRDTIREKYPVYLTTEVVRTELVKVTDTLRISDTLYQAVPIERREYAGDDYRAVVSGWHPSLDEIAVFPKTIYVQTEVQTQPPKKRARLGLGVTAGPGAVWNPQDGVRFGVGATAGLTLNF